MSLRTGQAALDWCAGQVNHPTRDWFTYCLIFSRSAFGVGAQYPDATSAWTHAAYKHGVTGTPPLAVPIWWTGGSSGHGHVAVSTGDGNCYSSDIVTHGKISLVPITRIVRQWGLTYKGWSEDINGAHVFTLPDPYVSSPAVDLSDTRDAIRQDFPLAVANEPGSPGLLLVENALIAEELLPAIKPSAGYSGVDWRHAYANWQRRCGVGGPYDGIPGIASLTKLGAKYGFTVMP